MMRGPRCDRLLCGFRYRLRFLSQPSAAPDSLTEDIRTHSRVLQAARLDLRDLVFRWQDGFDFEQICFRERDRDDPVTAKVFVGFWTRWERMDLLDKKSFGHSSELLTSAKCD